ncbi:MAG: NTP transferase domain-containing protein, partial [Alphaproteobacteria bacterium]|nr:NTP transferase domain-containing protein [Alphaproteobacteria bacterium]
MPPKAKTTARTLIPVILCGGTGSRLWPLSRQDYPKQLLALTGAETLLQQTARRFMGNDTFSVPMVISNDSYRFAVAEQLRQLDIAARLVLEPSPKNTAPAVAVAALIAAETDPDAVLIVAAAD